VPNFRRRASPFTVLPSFREVVVAGRELDRALVDESEILAQLQMMLRGKISLRPKSRRLGVAFGLQRARDVHKSQPRDVAGEHRQRAAIR